LKNKEIRKERRKREGEKREKGKARERKGRRKEGKNKERMKEINKARKRKTSTLELVLHISWRGRYWLVDT
jgi:hypothetical protein